MAIFSVMTVASGVCAMFNFKIIMNTMRSFKTNLFIVMMMWYNSMSDQQYAGKHEKRNGC